MEREKVFSRSGYYSVVVRQNLLGHREAAEIAARELAPRFGRRTPGKVVRVLDLACGGAPTTMAALFARFSSVRFDYTGIDIHPDQVAAARAFDGYPSNVGAIRVVQGNAWVPQSAGATGRYDLVYSGLNLHHGIPEELFFLARQVQQLLAPDGIVINHDLYRPEGTTYLRRPACNPADTAESYRMVDADLLAAAPMPALDIEGEVFGAHRTDWRDAWLQLYSALLHAAPADTRGIEETLTHVRHRDFPLSLAEMARVWRAAGYQVRVHDFRELQHPMRNYLGVLMAWKDATCML